MLVFDADALESGCVFLARIPLVDPLKPKGLLIARLESEDQELVIKLGRF